MEYVLNAEQKTVYGHDTVITAAGVSALNELFRCSKSQMNMPGLPAAAFNKMISEQQSDRPPEFNPVKT